MRNPVPAHPFGKSFETVEADVLPTLSALLRSVTETKDEPIGSFEARSAELRDMSRQIIELTRFLAAVASDASAQSADAKIRA